MNMNPLVAYGSSDEEGDGPPAKTHDAQSPPAHSRPRTPSAVAPAAATGTGPAPDAHPATPAPGPALPLSAASIGAEPGLRPPLSPYSDERQRIRELTMPTVPNFDIPDAPPPPPPNSEAAAALAATTRKLENFLELKKKGVHFNERLQDASSLRNPSLLPRLMEFAGISQQDSYRSSLPDGLAVVVDWPEECYVENLTKQNEKREKKRARPPGGKLDFVPSRRAGSTPGEPSGKPPGKQPPRKSKLDGR